MKLIAMLASAALILSACGGGGGGGGAGLVPESVAEPEPTAEPESVAEPEPTAEPESVAEPEPTAEPESVAEPEPTAEPESVAEPEPTAEPEPVAGPEPVAQPEPVAVPEPETLVQSYERLGLPDGFKANVADRATFLLANTPYLAGRAGGGLAAASLALQAGAVALHVEAQRAEGYRADHANIDGPFREVVDRVNPDVQTSIRWGGTHPSGSPYGHAYHNYCPNERGECIVHHPAAPGVSDGVGRPLRVPVEDMPFVSSTMREGATGVRTRNGVDLRYWTTAGTRDVPTPADEVPWAGWRVDTATDTWSGFGAWQEWSGFGMVMHTHDHQWDLYDTAWIYSIAGGDLTGSRPSSEIVGTMRGAAVARAADLSFIADGAVEMEVRLGAEPQVDVSIGDWRGYTVIDSAGTPDAGRIGSPTADVDIDDFTAQNMPIAEDGTFFRNSSDEFAGVLRGAFYGPRGSEAAGVFFIGSSRNDPDGISGAFGVRKPPDEE